MKYKLILISILITALFPAFSKGIVSSDQPKDEKSSSAVEDVSVSEEVSEAEEITSEFLSLDDLYSRLNQAGFDTPSNGVLPSIDFELPGLKGTVEKLSAYKGKVVFLNFWATWCGPCRSEMPSMEKMYNKLKDRGFVVLAVDLGEDKDTVLKYAEDLGLTFPIALDQTNEVGGSYDARSIPTTYLIGRDGNILGRAIGAREWDEDAFLELFSDILRM